MRAAIVNLYWATMGGGERALADIARALRPMVDEMVLVGGDEEFSLDKISDRLGVNIPWARYVGMPLNDERELAAYLSGFDLVINGTYKSRLRNPAPKGVRVVFFPERFGRLPKVFGRGVVFRASGFASYLPVRLLHGVVEYRLSQLPPKAIQFVLRASGSGQICTATVDGHECDFTYLTNTFRVKFEGHQSTRCIRLHVDGVVAETGLALADAYGHCWSPTEGDPYAQHASYNEVWANSTFTERHIRARWMRDWGVRVIHPAVDASPEAPTPRMNGRSILSVGRFFPGDHNKRHIDMVDAFRALVQREDGWSLTLVGGLGLGLAEQEYFRHLVEASRDLPVRLLTNIDREHLIRLYSQTTYYWHATGYGVDEVRFPEYVEHFGITPVEAMTLGCVPLVYGAGGASDYIKHGVNGFTWRNKEQLVGLTLWCSRNSEQAAAIAEEARRTAQLFSSAAHDEKVQVAISQLLASGSTARPRMGVFQNREGGGHSPRF